MAPRPPHRLKTESGFKPESQPQLLLCGLLVAGGAFLLLFLLTFLCSSCQRKSKDKKIKGDGVKLAGMGELNPPQLRPSHTPELTPTTHEPSRVLCNGENGLRSRPESKDFQRLSGTDDLEEDGDESRNSRCLQNRELPRIPGNNYADGKKPAGRKPNDAECYYTQVTNYPQRANRIEDSLYESVGAKGEPEPVVMRPSQQLKPPCERDRPAMPQLEEPSRGTKEPATEGSAAEYASIRKVKKKAKTPSLEDALAMPPGRNGKVNCAGLRTSVHSEERKVGEKPALFAKPEKYSPRNEDMKRITANKTTKPLRDCRGAESIACAKLTDRQTNSNTACFKKEVFTFSKSHEKLHSLTDEEIAGMYSKVVKKWPRKEVLLPARARIPREAKLNHRSWSADNLQEEEAEYEAIKSPHWRAGGRAPKAEHDYASVNDGHWSAGRSRPAEEETEPGYEAINVKPKRVEFPPKRGKTQRFPPARPAENYYESISELQQSRTHTRVLTCADGKQLFVTGL